MGTPIYWPEELLGVMPIQYGMQRQLAGENDYEVTDVDSGEPRRRLKYYTTIAKQDITLSFTDIKMQRFSAFYMQDLYKGTKAFLAKLPYPNGARIFRCRFDPTTYRDTYDTYNRWTVTASLEIRGIVTWDDGAQWLVDLFEGNELALLSEGVDLHTLLHTTYPNAVRGDMYV